MSARLPTAVSAAAAGSESVTPALERFDAYRVARDFARLAQALPIANSVLRDQWRRASLSVFTNVAEGAGRVAKADKRRCYAIARGEAFECAAMLDLIDDVPTEPRELIGRTIALLTALVR